MTKPELISAIQRAVKKTELSQAAVSMILDRCFATITQSIKKDGRFAYPGFGTFSVRNRRARKGKNPRTGETMMIKASKTVRFRPAPGFKKLL